MANWSETPRDVLISIAELLFSLEDFITFRAVCTSWRSAATKENFNTTSRRQLLPWLMLYNEHDHDNFYSLSRQKTYRLPLPHILACTSVTWIYSSLGWIMTIGEKKVNLFHPLSGSRIQLPNNDHPSIRKFVLHGSPISSPSTDCMVFLLHSFVTQYSGNSDHNSFHYINVEFWKPGKSTWTGIITRQNYFFDDIAYYNGRFYAVDKHNKVFVLNFEDDIDHDDEYPLRTNVISKITVSVVIQNVLQDFINPRIRKYCYLVESEESLLIVFLVQQRFGGFLCRIITVHEVNLKDGTMARVKSLGDRALFLCRISSSFSVKASNFSGCEANTIYIADSRWAGIFTLKDEFSGVFHRAKATFAFDLPPKLPSMWVQPTFV